ncbi:hypothetical protein Fcan01_12359 [Folsomia candida]|uniref:DUF4806 domain-containing protein n=1 Tax=Folsomia candida TaxID=158441 RepID=A0A226E5A8_FOLCA|nr:hypothetical protein Fcan01_12359 [Folsomia candida]
MFSVVKFLEDKSVQAVPSSWVSQDKKTCLWPPGLPSSVSASIKRRTEPEKHWTTNSIKFYKVADSLKEAKRFELDATADKVLDTTDAEDIVLKRKNSSTKPVLPIKRHKSTHSKESTSSDNDDELSSDNETSYGSRNLEISNDCNIFSQAELYSANSEAQNFSTSSFPTSKYTQGSGEKLGESGGTLISAGPDNHSLGSSQFTPLVEGDNFIPTSESFEEVVLRKLSEIQSDIRVLFSRLSSHQIETNTIDLPVVLPLNDEESVDELEAWIETDSNRRSLVKYLSSLGGRKPEKIVSRILSELFTPPLARRFNYSGGGSLGRQAFSVLKLKIALIDATKLNRIASDTTVDAIETTIKNWFRNARDKGEGGRKRKNVSTTKKGYSKGGSGAASKHDATPFTQ